MKRKKIINLTSIIMAIIMCITICSAFATAFATDGSNEVSEQTVPAETFIDDNVGAESMANAWKEAVSKYPYDACDVTQIQRHCARGEVTPKNGADLYVVYDTNNDGYVNIIDASILQLHLAESFNFIDKYADRR